MSPERLTEVLALFGATDELREELARVASVGMPPAAVRRVADHWAKGLPIQLAGELAGEPEVPGIVRAPHPDHGTE